MSYPREIRIEDPMEALIVEQALAMARDLKQVANDSPDGQVLSRAEQCALRQGHEFTRKSLEAVLNAQGKEVEKKFAGKRLPLRRSPHPPRTAWTKNLDRRWVCET